MIEHTRANKKIMPNKRTLFSMFKIEIVWGLLECRKLFQKNGVSSQNHTSFKDCEVSLSFRREILNKSDYIFTFTVPVQ